MIAAVSRRRRRRNHVATPVAASAAIADVRTLELAAIWRPPIAVVRYQPTTAMRVTTEPEVLAALLNERVHVG